MKERRPPAAAPEIPAGDISVLRKNLVHLLEEFNPDPSFLPGKGVSLIRSGMIDSLGLFQLALWIEKETRSRLDLATLDPATEWDTVEDILGFVARHRVLE